MFQWLSQLIGGQGSSANIPAPETVSFDTSSHDQTLDWLPASGPDRAEVTAWLSEPDTMARVLPGDTGPQALCVARRMGPIAYIAVVCAAPDAPTEARAGVCGSVMTALRSDGVAGFVVHAPETDGTLWTGLGFNPSHSFRRVHKTVGAFTVSGGHRGALLTDDELGSDRLTDLDEATFGLARPTKIQGLLTAEQVEAFGFEKDDQINAALVLRGNGDNRMRMSLAMGATLKDLGSLLHVVLVMKSGSTLEADVRVGGQVEAILDSLEFTEAADFPTLTEYRLGQTSGIGDGDGVHLLSWV